jgi:hypothetical protein
MKESNQVEPDFKVRWLVVTPMGQIQRSVEDSGNSGFSFRISRLSNQQHGNL